MKSEEKIKKLRAIMEREGIDYFIIPTSDPHMSEYVLDRYKSRVYMTGFTGSAGWAVVTKDKALLWADGRYHVQAAKEIKNTPFELMKWGLDGVPTWQEWLEEKVEDGEVIGFNGEIAPVSMLDNIKKLFPNNKLVYDKDIIGEFWEQRPELPKGKAFILGEEYTGISPTEKLEKVRERMDEEGVSSIYIASLPDICYLLNLRGSDDLYTPIVVSYLLIDRSSATLFVNENKIDQTVNGYLKKHAVKIRPYEEIVDALKSLNKEDMVWLDPNMTSALHYKLIEENANIFESELPSTIMKAVKNEVEIANTRKAHIIDGVALTRYLFWIKDNAGKIDMDEFSAEEKLHEFRSEGEGFLGESFKTISAYRANAAMAHYSASEKAHDKIKDDGIYLVDSGGQYYSGTTDVTRTITLGEPTKEEINDYTLTLKGHIRLFLAKFIKGTSGHYIDILAREAMWKEGIDFKHGTGHGVGHVLGVHEGPHRISTAPSSVALVPGMVVSNEPGIYREGKHGIRIENLVVVQEYKTTQFGTFYGFENLTFTPYERELIDVSILTEEEIDYIDNYHAECLNKLIHGMKTPEEKEKLKEVTKPLVRH
ncbi:MAG: aminopeptidase P family protein [Firmicutes bacterium]|nr:aminopeptidase P family protein [Bacillota bacterium]